MYSSNTPPTELVVVHASLSTAESVVKFLSVYGLGNNSEQWVTRLAQQINKHFKDLRDDLRLNKHNWSYAEYCERLAYNYYSLSDCHNTMFQNYRVDLESVVEWLEKCYEMIRSVPTEQMTDDLINLKKDVYKQWGEVKQLYKRLERKFMRLLASNDETKAVKLVELGLALGKVKHFHTLLEASSHLEGGELYKQSLQVVVVLRLIVLLEDSITIPNHENNLLLLSRRSRSLANAYSLLGVDNLSKRYKKTSEWLLKSSLNLKSFIGHKNIYIKTLVEEQLMKRNSLQQVKSYIEEVSGTSLSIIDRSYIEQKYVKYCSDLVVDETVDFLKSLVENKNRADIMKIFGQLSSAESLDQISHPINLLQFFKLLAQNYDLLRTHEKYKLLRLLKRSCFKVIIDYINLAKQELIFQDMFIDFLCSVKNSKNVEDSLNLQHFCNSHYPFNELIRDIMSLKPNVSEGLAAVQLAAVPLIDEVDLFYTDEFRDFVRAFIKPLTVQKIHVDGRMVLEVSGKKIVLTEIIENETFLQGLGDPSCEEVRFVGTSIIHADANFEKANWHGKNIVVYTRTLHVHGNVTWDVSGKDCEYAYPNDAGSYPDGSGVHGEDGLPGESGGNILVLAEVILNSNNLCLISNGGKGGRGQDGGGGRDGFDGISIEKHDFEVKFPRATQFQLEDNGLLITLKSILEYSPEIKSIWSERLGIISATNSLSQLTQTPHTKSVGHEKYLEKIIADLETYLDSHKYVSEYNDTIFIEAVASTGNKIMFSFESGCAGDCQAFLLFKGAEGRPGMKGGIGGYGGPGGCSGEISIENPKDHSMHFFVQVSSTNGEEGESGLGGFNGNCGKLGYDMGYMDFSSSMLSSEEWPKLFGTEKNCKIVLNYYSSDDGPQIKCSYRQCIVGSEDCYIDMKESKLECIKRKAERAEPLTENIEKSLSKAVQKKTISFGNILFNYQQHFCWTEKILVHKLLSELDNVISRILQAIAENEQCEEKVTVTTRTTRCVTFQGERNHDFDLSPTYPCSNKRQAPLVENTCNTIIGNPFSLSAWVKLKQVEVPKLYFDELFSALSVAKNNMSQMLDTPENVPKGLVLKNLEEQLLAKHSSAVLNEISKKLQALGSERKNVDSTEPTDVSDYLKVVDGFDSNKIWHPVLGCFYEYIYTHCRDSWNEVSKFYLEEIGTKSNLLNPLQTFIIEHGKSADATEEIKYYFQLYNSVFEAKNQPDVHQREMLITLHQECLQDAILVEEFHKCVATKGFQATYCKELLALVFDVSINIYCHKLDYGTSYFTLKENYNPSGKLSTHFSSQSGKFLPLEVDFDSWQLEKQYYNDGLRCMHILKEIELFRDPKDIDEYLERKIFFCDQQDFDNFSLSAAIDEEAVIDKIIQHFDSLEDSALLKSRLCKLGADYVGAPLILHYVQRRFSLDGRHVSIDELCSLINSVMTSVACNKKLYYSYCWIVAACAQDQWTCEILLLEIERHLGKSLSLKNKWRNYMQQIPNKDVLVRLREKIVLSSKNDDILTDSIDAIFQLLSKVPKSVFHFRELDLSDWPHILKGEYWLHKLSELIKWDDKSMLSLSAYHILSLENIHGTRLIDGLLNILLSKKRELTATSQLLFYIFNHFYLEQWDLGDVELKMLSNCRSIQDWVMKMNDKFKEAGDERNINRLVSLMGNSNLSFNVKQILPTVKNLLKTTSEITLESSIISKQDSNNKTLHEFDESDIQEWVTAFQNKIKEQTVLAQKTYFFNGLLGEMLAVVERAIELKKGFRLRDTQRLAASVLLKNDRSTLAQVCTGEGKSLIVVTVAIIKALVGEKVDVVTSSSVLAKRDAEIHRDIYSLFGINISHNSSEDIEVRKMAYSGNQVVYGDLSDFQRDYLLHEFYGKNVLGDRNFESVIIDEVDSMLLDKGNNMLYLSHDLPGLEKLEALYIFIWQYINRPCSDELDILGCFDTRTIKDAVLFDLYGLIRKEDIKKLDFGMTNQQVCEVWNSLVDSNIIDSLGRLKIISINKQDFENAVTPLCEHIKDRLYYLVKQCLSRNKLILVPNCFKPFIETHLDIWINIAITAFFMKAGEDYVVDIDRTGLSSDLNPNITIIDKDTGTDQASSQWEEGLHQFLQLKHGCKLSAISLKAVFVSNVSYFKLYKKMYGLTGTLGSPVERASLQEAHDLDFVTIPTAKVIQFCEAEPIICTGSDEWVNCILSVACQLTSHKNRSVLVICKTVNDAECLHQAFRRQAGSKIHFYTRDYEEFDVTQSSNELSPGHIIIATNLAGRGTDIKIDSQLRSAGGLHVILTYLPNNKRVEQQAFGRAARCGDRGSGQLIIKTVRQKSSILNTLDLKKERDLAELERTSTIKNFYKNQVCVEEHCFKKFKDLYNLLKKRLLAGLDNGDAISPHVFELLLKSCIDKWAFWLDENKSLISNTSGNLNCLESSLNVFLEKLAQLQSNNILDWIPWVKNCPTFMIKLGKIYLEMGVSCAAISLFDQVINQEPLFSEAAHYYKAFALARTISWDLFTEADSNVKRLKVALHSALKLFEEHRDRALRNAAIVNQTKLVDKLSIVSVNAYEEQQKNIVNLYSFFCKSIQDINGYPINPLVFVTQDINEAVAESMYSFLLGAGILSHPKITMENCTDEELELLCKGYDIPVTSLTRYLRQQDGTVVNDIRSIQNQLKKVLYLSSKERFWKELLQKSSTKVVFDEVKYVIVNEKKLFEVDPSLLQVLESCGINDSISNKTLDPQSDQLFLNTEQLADQLGSKFIFIKKDFISLIGRKKYETFKRKGFLSFNRKCTFVLDTLHAAAFSTRMISLKDLTDSNIGRDDAVRIIANLEKNNVIISLNNYEKYGIVHECKETEYLIDEMAIPHKSMVKEILRLAMFQLSSCDSISLQNLLDYNIGQMDAIMILQELEAQNIIAKRPKNDEYHLVVPYRKISTVSLSCPLYNYSVKAILRTTFAYRIALQKLVLHMKQQSLPAKIQLKTKPERSLFWDMFDLNIISSVKVCSTNNLEKRMKKLFPVKNSERKIDRLLSREVRSEEVDDLIEQLVEKRWLLACSCCNNEDSPSTYEINSSKSDRKPLNLPYKNIEKTIEALLDEALLLSNENTIRNAVQLLRKMGLPLEDSKDSKFSLKSLVQACNEGHFLGAEEIYPFLQSGLEELLLLGHRTYTYELKANSSTVTQLGTCHIGVGIASYMSSIGAMTYMDNETLNDCINKLFFGLDAQTPHPSVWKNLEKYKLEQLAISSFTAVTRMFQSRGTENLCVGHKLRVPHIKIGLEKRAQPSAMQYVSKEVLKASHILIEQASQDTVGRVESSVHNMVLDIIITNFLFNLCNDIHFDISTKIAHELQNHGVVSKIKRAFDSLGKPAAQKLLLDASQQFFDNTAEWDYFVSVSNSVSINVSRSISELARKNLKNDASVSDLKFFLNTVQKQQVWSQRPKHVIEASKITIKMLDSLAEDIEKELATKAPAEGVPTMNSGCLALQREIAEGWKTLILEKIGCIIHKHIVNPVLTNAAQVLFGFAIKTVANFYEKYKQEGVSYIFHEYKYQYEDRIQNKMDIIEIDLMTKEYHKNLMRLLVKTKNPKILSAIVRENVPLEPFCLKELLKILPDILRERGVFQRVKIVVEGRNEILEFKSRGEGDFEHVIRLNFENADSSWGGSKCHFSSSMVLTTEYLIRSIMEHLSVTNLSIEDFKEFIAGAIEGNQPVINPSQSVVPNREDDLSASNDINFVPRPAMC